MATAKQKKALSKMIKNNGNVSKAMREAGYSKNTSKTPKKLTESAGFKELLETHLPDTLLMEKHAELLTVPKKVRKFVKGELEMEYEELDSQAISKGLDMAYKIKGKYAPEKSINFNVNADVTHNKKAQKVADKYEEELRDALQEDE